MTGTPAGVAALSPGDKIECGVDGVGTLKVAIGKPAIEREGRSTTAKTGPRPPFGAFFGSEFAVFHPAGDKFAVH